MNATVNPNSALHWLPAARRAAAENDLYTPKTAVVRFDFMDAVAWVDDAGSDLPWQDFADAAAEVGWPVFVRTDLTSAKHRGIDAIRADDSDDLRPVLRHLTTQCAKQWMNPGALLFREWIDIDARFTAKDGLPIGPEFRVFAAPSTYHCTHFYWPADSLEATAPDGWEREHQRLAAHELPTALQDAAEHATRRANDRDDLADDTAWSVDFAKDVDGDWWLIDMARSEDSWHPDDCPEVFEP